MTDIFSIIENATKDADTGSESDGSVTEAADAEATPETKVGESVEDVSSAAAVVDPPQPVVEVDPLAKELEELGLKPHVEGQAVNRIPQPRVVKMIEKAKEKAKALWETEHAAALAERDGKLTAAEKRLANMDAVDRLIAEDSDRYLEMLAALHPTYKKYLGGGAKPAEAKPAPVVSEPAPEPDAQFEDGSIGYSAAGLQKLLEWQARQVESRVTKQVEETYTKRFGPIEKNWQAQQLLNEKMPAIRQQIEQAKQTWGKAFEDDYGKNEQSEILGYLRAHPTVSFDAAVATVLIPKIHAERNTMRAEILKEINERPKAAVKGSPAAVSGAKDTGPRSVEDIVREAAEALEQ